MGYRTRVERIERLRQQGAIGLEDWGRLLREARTAHMREAAGGLATRGRGAPSQRFQEASAGHEGMYDPAHPVIVIDRDAPAATTRFIEVGRYGHE